MIMILNHVHDGEKDSVIMKVSLNTLSAIHLPLGQNPSCSQRYAAWWGELRSADPSQIAHLSTVSSVTWTLGVCCPGEASCGFADKLFHTKQLVPGLPLRWEAQRAAPARVACGMRVQSPDWRVLVCGCRKHWECRVRQGVRCLLWFIKCYLYCIIFCKIHSKCEV